VGVLPRDVPRGAVEVLQEVVEPAVVGSPLGPFADDVACLVERAPGSGAAVPTDQLPVERAGRDDLFVPGKVQLPGTLGPPPVAEADDVLGALPAGDWIVDTPGVRAPA
jgi:hypothetical protein